MANIVIYQCQKEKNLSTFRKAAPVISDMHTGAVRPENASHPIQA